MLATSSSLIILYYKSHRLQLPMRRRDNKDSQCSWCACASLSRENDLCHHIVFEYQSFRSLAHLVPVDLVVLQIASEFCVAAVARLSSLMYYSKTIAQNVEVLHSRIHFSAGQIIIAREYTDWPAGAAHLQNAKKIGDSITRRSSQDCAATARRTR